MSHVDASPRGLVSDALVTDRDRAEFSRDGFRRLRQILTTEAVEGLREVAERKVAEQASGYDDNAMRIAYRLHESAQVQEILHDPSLADLLRGLTGTGLIPTETQAFELTRERSAVPWHFGYISYGYIRARDMGYTLWIPLGAVDPAVGGGMAYVPEHLVSARHGYDMGSLLAPRLLAGDDPTELLAGFDAVHEAMKPVFEEHKVEDAFEAGDALLFNKNVWHRSSPYANAGSPGGERRVGIAMRFVAETACVDRVRWTAEYGFGGGIGTGQRRAVMAGTEDRFTRFADISDGAPVRTSADCTLIL